MSRQVGAPRSLNRGQIRRVLRWQARLIRFRQQQGTLSSLAHSVGITVHELRCALKGQVDGLTLSDEQRRLIERWNVRRRQFRRRHLSARALARALGVSRSTIFDCIRRQGNYRQLDIGGLSRKHNASAARTTVPLSAVDTRSTLLRAWRRFASEDES